MSKQSLSKKNVNPLVASLNEEYAALWDDLSVKKAFNRQVRFSNNKNVWILERDKHFHTEASCAGCNPKEIPCIEISDKIFEGSPLLFVGMNPSGTDKKCYSGNKDDVFVYHEESSYYKAMTDFAKDCLENTEDCYSELDLFGIVQSSQSVVQRDFLENPDCYKEMFGLFLKYATLVHPKVVIVANAFARRILLKDESLQLSLPKYDSFYKSSFSLKPNNCFGGYTFTMKDFTAQLYFSSMLSGQRALDKGSRENLVWLVKNYLLKTH